MYVILQPYNLNTVNVCWVCFNFYSSQTRILKPGVSTAEDIINLEYKLKNES